MEPTVCREGDAFIYRWSDAEIDVDRWTPERETISAEATIWALLPERVFIHRARLNLLATPTKAHLIKHLAGRRNEIDWESYVEYAAVLTVDAIRKGEPWVTLGCLERRTAPRFALAPLLPWNQTTLIFGPGGSCKSTLLNAVAVALASGRPLAGLQPPQEMGVLCADWETDEYEHQERCEALAAGMGMTGLPFLYYARYTQPLYEVADDLVRRVARERVQFVAIDSYGYACGGDPNDPHVALKMFSAMRRLGCTVAVLDHVAKHGQGEATPYGSVYKINSARMVWEVRLQAEPNAGRLQVGLFNTKANSGPRAAPVGLEIEYVGANPAERIGFRRIDVRDVPELRAPLRDRLLYELRRGAMSAVSLADELGEKPETVAPMLSRLKAAGLVANVGGAWSLVSEREDFS